MDISITQNTVNLSGPVSIMEVNHVIEKLRQLIQEKHPPKIQIDLKSSTIKASTAAILNESLIELSTQTGIPISLAGAKPKMNLADEETQSNVKKSNFSGFLIRLGESSIKTQDETKKNLLFLQTFLDELIKDLMSPKKFRFKEIVSQIDQTGFFAIGIVALVTFLIGIVIAYLMGNQLRYYGANIFVVDGVAVSMCRELSPILVAIVVAGRSGSAFAAELGSMKLNHETDALEVMGLKPFQVLVLPRIIGLMISLPFLVLIGDVFGILGGMFISNIHLDITYSNFIERMHLALKPRQVLVGLAKAPVFALFIAAIGCRLGLGSLPNAVSIGRNTTKTVVHSIVSVILLNAGFAIIFTQLGI